MSQEDLNEILDVALSMGCDGLEKEGFFYPYAVTLEYSGDFQRGGELSDEDKARDPEELLQQMHATLAAGCRQKMHKAVAIGVDVKVKHPQEGSYVKAVEVSIEHEDGTAVTCYLPYQKIAEGNIQYGNIFSTGFLQPTRPAIAIDAPIRDKNFFRVIVSATSTVPSGNSFTINESISFE